MSLTGTTLPHVKSWTRGYVFTFHLVCKCFQFFLFDCILYWYSLLLTCDLGSVCFGCKWFQEIIFRKIGCLVGFENRLFRKCFSVDLSVRCKMISVFILPSNIIFWKTERERERERERKKRELITGDPRAFDFVGDPETLRHEPTNQSSTSLANPEPLTHEPSTSPAT